VHGAISVTAVAILFSATDSRAQQNLTLQTVLDRLHAYLADYAERLPATIATERYEQRCGSPSSSERVSLVSEFGIMRLGPPGGWLGLRDVLSVDGRSIPDREQRLQDLFTSPSARGIQQARRIAQQNARFNVGRIQRTINDPAVVLELLDGRNATRMRFKRIEETITNGTNVWAVTFVERRRPTIIQTSEGRDQPARGTASIDPLTGRLTRVTLMIENAADRIGIIDRAGFTATIDVLFKDEPRLGFWVPSGMTERYDSRESRCSGEATYSNYRTFGVETRIVSP
jgi:hypothetical protein